MRLVLLLFLCTLCPEAWAHGMRTGYLEISELRPGEVILSLRSPALVRGVNLDLPAGCVPHGSAPFPTLMGNSSLRLRCTAPLSGQPIRLEGLGPQLGEVVVWVSFSDGTVASHLLTAASPGWRLPGALGVQEVSWEYIGLGLRHILGGADHLLFLLLLVLGMRDWRPVLVAETAFTLSHSLSFTATALGWVRVAAPAAEACIALSLLLLALELKSAASPPLPPAQGAGLALVFGLVHGLGFAGGLHEVGLPEQGVPWALLGFGAGVELGQVGFLLVALLGRQLLARSRHYPSGAFLATHLAGGLSACWLFERVHLCLGRPGVTP